MLFCLFVPSLRESDGGVIFWTKPHPLMSCPFQEYSGCFFNFLPLNLLLVRSHQAEISSMKLLIQGRNNVCDESESWTLITWLWSQGRHKNGSLTLSATLPDFLLHFFYKNNFIRTWGSYFAQNLRTIKNNSCLSRRTKSQILS